MFGLSLLFRSIKRAAWGQIDAHSSLVDGRNPTFSLAVVDDLIVHVDGIVPAIVTEGVVAEGAATGPVPGCHWTTALDLLQSSDTGLLQTPVENLLAHGEAFSIFAHAKDGCIYRISGATFSRQAVLRFHQLSVSEIQLHADLVAANAARLDAEALVDAFARAPVAAVHTNQDGKIRWESDLAEDLATRLKSPAGLTKPSERTITAATKDKSGERHLKVSGIGVQGTGGQLFVVEDRTEAISTRAMLSSFMSTMTETFAQLGTALAVFDDQKCLSLFNPSFTDLFGLDPAGLAGRPTLRDVLDAMRHARKLPEQAHFKTWRENFINDITNAQDSAVVEDWFLPGGETLRVTARPHGGGSVVLLFEDISDHVSLERRYRVEIETGQSILDRLGEGIAVFSSSGQVVYCNPAFGNALGFDPFRNLLAGGIQSFVDHVSGAFGQSDDWQSFREYALGTERRKDWVRSVPQPGGGVMFLRANPLPDGSTMLVVAAGPGPVQVETEYVEAETIAKPQIRGVGG